MTTRPSISAVGSDWPAPHSWARVPQAGDQVGNIIITETPPAQARVKAAALNRGSWILYRRLVVGSMLSFLAGYGGSSSASAMPPLSQQVAAIVQPQLDEHPDLSVGVAVGVVEPGNSGAITTSVFYFGRLIDENKNPIPLDGATEFEIGSVTKTFTTTVLASMIQERPSLFNIHINRIFPQTPTFNGQQIRIRDLADYTSGLPDSNRDGGSASCMFSGGTIEDCYDLSLMFQHLSNPALSALQFAPGTAYLYSDLAVAILALAEPIFSGTRTKDPLLLLKEWEALVDSIVLNPLRMKLTHAFDPAFDPPLLPQGYTVNSSGQITPALNHNTSWPAFIGAGGIVSTPNDMMIYLEYNLGVLDTPLNSLLAALHTPSTKVTTPGGLQLALGWFIGTLPGSTIQLIGKNGGVPGFNSQIYFAPSTSTGVFVLVNTSGEKGQSKIVDVTTITSQVMQIINGLPPTAPGPSDDQP